MRYRGKYRRSLLILGAGATRGSYSQTTHRRIVAPLNSDFLAIASRFVGLDGHRRYRPAFERLEKFVREEMHLRASEQPTMEELFSVLFISKDMPKIFRSGPGRPRRGGYRREIDDFFTLLLAIFRFVQLWCHHRAGFRHYPALAERLEGEDTVVTLNYDTAMDVALAEQGWDPRTGYGFRASNSRVTGIRQAEGRSRLRRVRLIKPHGSFSWFGKGRREELEKLLSRRPPSQVRLSRAPGLYERPSQRLTRFFVPPLYSKFLDNNFWRALWRKVYESVRSARELIFVGCSLVPTDFHFRAILSKALKDRGAKKFDRIILVEPSSKVRKELKSFFRGTSRSGFKVHADFTAFLRWLRRQT